MVGRVVGLFVRACVSCGIAGLRAMVLEVCAVVSVSGILGVLGWFSRCPVAELVVLTGLSVDGYVCCCGLPVIFNFVWGWYNIELGRFWWL